MVGRFVALVLALGPATTPPEGPTKLFGYPHAMLPPDSTLTEGAAVGDLDGDEDVDFIAVHNFAQPPTLALGDGWGSFTDASANVPTIPSDAMFAVAIGDLDQDGDRDALIGQAPGWIEPTGEEILLRNDGSGVFSDVSSNLPANSDSTVAVALFDADSDADLDAFTANSVQNRLYRNDGAGVFSDATADLPAVVASSLAVAVGDVDGDGDPDLLIGNDGQDILHVNDGHGSFLDASANLPVDSDRTSAVVLGDTDGDQDLDLFAGTWTQDRLLLNDGEGAFGLAIGALPQDADFAGGLALGDVDADHDLDAIVGNVLSPDRLLLNDGVAAFSVSNGLPAAGSATSTVALMDLDRDGDLDGLLFQGNGGAWNDSQDRLFLNDGKGVFSDTLGNLPVALAYQKDVQLGDLDGDRNVDAFVAASYKSRVLLQTSPWSFVDAAGALPASSNAEAVALADLDGDGDLDAIVADPPSGKETLLKNDSTGVFADASANLPANPAPTPALAVGDVDSDMDLDVLLGNGGGAWIPAAPEALFVNDGAGAFADASADLPVAYDPTSAVVLGDVDGDADLDAYLAGGDESNGSPAFDSLWINDGTGTFTSAAGMIPTLLAPTLAVAFGDLDGDLDLDLALGYQAHPNQLLLNDGLGDFTGASVVLPSPAAVDTRAIALGDVDEDLDLDVWMGNFFTPDDQLFRNDGSGTFTDSTSLLPRESDLTDGLALADVDEDGDLDAFSANGGGRIDRVYANLSRHLARRGLPRIGKPLLLDLNGPPGTAWVLLAGLQMAKMELPFGILWLDPGSAVVTQVGPFDGNGSATATFRVNEEPSLVGLVLHWQAVAGPPPRLTNCETTVFTDL